MQVAILDWSRRKPLIDISTIPDRSRRRPLINISIPDQSRRKPLIDITTPDQSRRRPLIIIPGILNQSRRKPLIDIPIPDYQSRRTPLIIIKVEEDLWSSFHSKLKYKRTFDRHSIPDRSRRGPFIVIPATPDQSRRGPLIVIPDNPIFKIKIGKFPGHPTCQELFPELSITS